MLRIRKMLALLGAVGVLLAIPAATASAGTTGAPTAPDGVNDNNRNLVCHHNAPPNGAVTVFLPTGNVIENGSGGGFCGNDA